MIFKLSRQAYLPPYLEVKPGFCYWSDLEKITAHKYKWNTSGVVRRKAASLLPLQRAINCVLKITRIASVLGLLVRQSAATPAALCDTRMFSCLLVQAHGQQGVSRSKNKTLVTVDCARSLAAVKSGQLHCHHSCDANTHQLRICPISSNVKIYLQWDYFSCWSATETVTDALEPHLC